MEEAAQQMVLITCPWCGGDEISARTVTDMVYDDGSRSMKDICRCADCGRTFTVAVSKKPR